MRRWELGLSDPQIDLLTAVIHRLGIDVSQVVVTDPATRMLTDWRYQRLMTRPQLAEHARMTVTLLGRVERGEAELTRERESQLAKALRISKAQVRRAYLLARTRGPGTFA